VTGARGVAVLLTIAGLTLPAAAVAVSESGAPLFTVGMTGVVFTVLGALILTRRPGHRMGWLYLAIGVEIGAFHLVNSLSLEGAVDLSLWQLALGWFGGAGWALGPLLAVTFGLLWLPDGRLPSRRWRAVSWVTWSAIVGVAAVFPMTESPEPVREAIPVSPEVAEIAFLAIALVVAVAVLACVVSPFVRYRHADVRTRQQLRLVGLGGLLGVAIYLTGDLTTSTIPGLTWEHVFALAVLAMPVTAGVAIVRYGMLDIGRILSRTLAYAIVTAVLAGVYALGVLVVGQVVPSEGNDLLVAGSTLAVAALFLPVRKTVQTAVDRRFSRSRYDAEQAVATFRLRLRDELDLATVADELCDVVGQTLMPSHVALVLTGGGRRGK
jgi:hypothetical protein